MSPTLLDVRTPVARRGYRCEWCVEMIAKGERHEAQIIADDGHVWTFRTHTECGALIQRLYDEGRGDPEFGVCPDYGSHERGRRCHECGALTAPATFCTHARSSDVPVDPFEEEA